MDYNNMETNITPEESTIVETAVETQPAVEPIAVPEVQMPLQQDPPKRKLWKLLTSKEGGEVYTKSYDDFILQFNTPEKVKSLHDLIASPDYELYTKGADAFEQQFFSDIKKKEPVGEVPSTGLPVGESVFTEQTTEVPKQPEQVTTETTAVSVSGQPLPLPEGYDAISLALKANELKDKKIKRSVTSKNVMGQDITTTIEDPDEAAIAESKRISQELKSYGINADEIYNKIKDLPEEVYNIQVKKADGTIYNKYSKDNLTKLALESPVTFDYTINLYKNRFALKKAINELDPDYKAQLIREGKPVDGAYLSELYASLNQAESLEQFEQNQIKQQELINTYLPTMEERTAALSRAKENTSMFLTPNNLEIVKAYDQSPLKDKIDIYQFSALEVMKLYNPTQYQQTIDYIQTPTDVISGRGNEMLEKMGLGEKGETQTSVLSRLGKEKILKKLFDEGRNNALLDLQRKGEKLIAASKKATTPEILDNIKQQYSDNESLIKEIKDDFSLDNYRYPLSNTLQYQTRIKDFLNQSGMNAIEFGVSRFGISMNKTAQSLSNLLLSALPENAVTKRIRLSAIGEKDFENFAMYMPEKYQGKNPDFVFQYSPQLKQKLDNITKGKDYSDLSEKEKVEMTQIMLDNQDQIKTVTNPKAGKDKNFFSLATLYSNTGMLGDIASFAVQAGVLKGAGVASDALASAIPMWTTAQDDYYKEGLEKGVQDPNGYAFTHASIMFMAGLINPSLSIVKRAVGINTPAGRMLAGVSEKTWNNVVNKNSQLLTRIQNSVSHTVKEAAGMAATFGAGTAIAGDIINREMYAENISNEQILDNAFESVKHILTSSAGLLTIGAISNFKGASMVEKSALWQLSDNPEFNIATIENAFKEGKISEDEAISRKKVVKDVSELIAKMPNKNSKGKLMTDNERLDYFYNLLLKKQGEEQKSVMPKPQQAKIDFATKVIDFENDLIVDPKTEDELTQRKSELEDLLSPKVDEKGNPLELKKDEKEDYEAELEAINRQIDKINKEKQPTQTTEQILNDEPGTETVQEEVEEKAVKEIAKETTPTEIAGYKVVSEETPVGGERVFKVVDENGNERFMTADGKELKTAMVEIPAVEPKAKEEVIEVKLPEIEVIEETTTPPTKKTEEQKTFTATDIKENPDSIKEDPDYYTIGYPDSFISLYTDRVLLEKNGYKDAKKGDIVTIGKKDYVIESIEKTKKGESVKLLRVDKEGSLLRQKDLSKKEQAELEKEPEVEQEETEPEVELPTTETSKIEATTKKLEEFDSTIKKTSKTKGTTLYHKAIELIGNTIKFNYRGWGAVSEAYHKALETTEKDRTPQQTELIKLINDALGIEEPLPSSKEEKIKPEFKEPESPSERKSLADKIRQLKSGKGKAYDAVLGIPVAVWDGTVELIAKAIEGGVAVADALKRGINYIEKNHRGRWDKKGFNDKVIESLGLKGINVNGEDIIVKPLKDKQSAEVINGFYSPLEQGILDANVEKATGKEWAKKLEGTTEGDELRFTGVSDFLSENANEVLTKQEVLDFMKENRIEINEVVKGKDKFNLSQSAMDEVYNDINESLSRTNQPEEVKDFVQDYLDNWYNNPSNENYKKLDAALGEANLNLDDYIDNASEKLDDTKYYNYQLPGEKTNYKEVLITLPRKKGWLIESHPSFDTLDYTKNTYGVNSSEYNSIKRTIWNEIADKVDIEFANRMFKDYESTPNLFKSSHYDEPNILAHIRMNTRVDAEGNKVLHIEEFQSDWGQKGKKVGFDDINRNKYLKKQEELEDKIWGYVKNNYSDVYQNITKKEFVKDKIIGSYAESDSKLNSLWEQLKDNNSNISKFKKITPAPFITETANWTKLAWKVALKEAVKEGADKITWTTGEQQNERYDLRKQVDSINYYKKADGNYNIDAIKNGTSISSGVYKESELEGILGKEVAKKIIANEGDTRTKTEFGKETRYKSLSGDNLAVGGKGMLGFYGSPKEGKIGIVGEVAKSLFKQEPKTTELKTSEFSAGYRKIKDTEGIKESSKKGYRFVYEDKNISKQEAYEIIEKGGEVKAFLPDITSSQHSIDITPEMKQAVESGLPIFKSNIQKIADGIRKAKLDLSKLSDGGMQSNIFGIPIMIYNGVLEAVALAIEKGESLTKAIDSAIKKYKLDESEDFDKIKLIESLEDATGEKYEGSKETIITIESKNPFLYRGSDKKRVAGLMRNLMEAENVSDRTKQLLKKDEGLEYAVASNVDAEIMANDVINSFGEKDALQIARQNDMHPSVRSAIYAKLIDSAYEKELNAKTKKEKAAAAERWAELSKEYSRQLTAGGQFTAYAGHYYRTSPMGFVMRENAIRADLFEDWLKGREESYNDIYKQIIESEEFKQEVSKATEEGVKEERKARREKRDKNIDDFFDSAKMKGGTYLTIIPPALWNKTMDAMKLAVKAGDRVVDIVQKAIEDISKEIGDNWDKEKFRKDFESSLTKVADEGQKEKTRITDLESKIKSLEKQIEDYKEKIAKGGEAGKKKEVKFSDDPEVKKLIEERDRLKKENEELLKASKQGKYSDEARNEAAQKAAQKAIDDLELRLKNNDLAIERSEKLNETQKTKELREKRKQLSKELDDRRKAAKVGKYSDQAKAIAEAKRKQERIDELNRRINEKDFSSEVYKAKKAKDGLQIQLDEVKERYKQEREKSKEWKEKKARQFLEKFKDKWPGLTEAQKKKVIEESIKKIAESGGLKEEEFRKFVAEALGIKEVTPEEAKEMEELTDTINKVDDALQAMLQNPTRATIAAYQQAKQAASIAGLRLKTMVTTKENIAATYKSIITGSLLGIVTNITNLLSNVIYQATVRFETAALKQAGELGTYGSSVIANRLFNTRLYEPTSNLIEAQKGYLSGQKAGWKTGWFDFYNNTQQKDYFSKNTYRSTLDPKNALKDIKDWWKGEKYLTKGQLHDRIVRVTLGWQPDFILRAMSFGDRPFRWGAEQAKARQIAVMELKLKDTNEILAFLSNPKDFSEKIFLDRGESAEKAETKSQEIEDRILEEGNKAVFEVETLLSWFSNKVDTILTTKKDETFNKRALKNFGAILKTSQLPFIRIPAYMYWTMYKIINPEISLAQMAYHFGEAKYWDSKGEGAKSRAAFEKAKDDAYLAAYGAAVGLAVTALAGGGYVRPSNDEETKAREAAGEKTFGKQGVFNLGRALGTNDWWVSLKWFGPLGAALDTRAKINEERQKELIKTGVPEEFTMIDDMSDNLTQGAKDAMNNLVFDNAARIANSIKTPETAGKEWMVYNSNTVQKMFTGATYAQVSKAMLPYQANTKADGMIEEINNNAKTQNILYRFVTGKPKPRISIWGEPIKQDNTLSGVMFNILGWEKGNPNQYGAILFSDYLKEKDDRFFPVPEDKTFTVDGKRVDITQEQKDDLDIFVGQARKDMVGPFIYDLVATNAYTNAEDPDPAKLKTYSELTPAEKIEALTWVYKSAKDSGYARFKLKYPQFLGADDKAKELVDKAMRDARKTLIDVDVIRKGGEIKKP